MKTIKDNTLEANKRLAKRMRTLQSVKMTVWDTCVRIGAFVLSLFAFRRKKRVEQIKLHTKDKRDIVINCMGCIDLGGSTAGYASNLKSIRNVLLEADISFASSRFGKKHTKRYENLRRSLDVYRIRDVSYDNPYIRSWLYRTEVGNMAVISFMQSYAEAAKHHNRLELAKEYHVVKQMGAEYVIVYIDSKQLRFTTERDRELYDFLLKLGVDYIVGIKPQNCDSGVTYRQKNGSVSRGVFSIGTLLGNSERLPDGRAVLRLKLRKVNGKLQAYYETYYPLYRDPNSGIKNLLDAKMKLRKEEKKVLASIERSLPRIRHADKVITVGDIVETVNAQLPQKYEYIRDFSVGTISAKPYGHKPGDVFIRWQPHKDPNDALTYNQRVKDAKTETVRNSKIDMFIISHMHYPIKCPHVVVPDSMEAHISVGTYLRNQHNVRCIAITGSIGKTSTKDMLAEVMKLRYNTVKSLKNENVHSRISLALQRITSDAEVYIQELGGGRPGGASRHSRMVLPEATVITNIGDAHIGNFYGDQMALMRNKLQIIDGMPENGVIYLNGDDPLLKDAMPDCKRVLYAVHNKEADYYADNLVEKDNKTYFDIVYGCQRVEACVNVPGEHNVLNAVCSFAIGRQFGIPERTIVRGIANFRTQGIRQNMVQASGRSLFFDCFNASSGSVESSIKTLRQIVVPEGSKRVAMLGDVTGLGDLAEQTHRELAEVLMANPVDLYLFYGTNTRLTCDILKENGFDAYYTPDYDQLVAWLQEKTASGDAIMAKGSSKMKLEYAFDSAFGTRSFDAAMIEEGTYCRVELSGVSYNMFSTHATAVRVKAEKTDVRVREKVGKVTVCSLGTTFNSSSLVNVELPGTIRHIGVRSFENCKKLKAVTGADGLKFIGVSAFHNCVSLETITLPDTLLHIGNNAFNGCASLEELYIPESVVQIGPGAFENCPKLRLSCKAGSYAEQYCQQSNLEYKSK